MMKKTKAFNVGDKVFAKVKGYPAWPAKIVAASGKKYDVTFYGTMETGSIKVEDLFYYLKHKEQFCRNLKRKDYQEAVEQIEAEIKETGTDGNNDDETDTSAVGDVFEKKGKKRKRESINEEVQDKKIKPTEDLDEHQEDEEKSDENRTSQDNDTKNPLQSTTRSGRIVKLKKFSDDEDEEVDKKNTKVRKSTSVSEEANTKLEQSEKEEIEPEKAIDSVVEDTAKSTDEETPDNVTDKKETVPETEEIVDVNILPVDYLETVIAYAEHVKSKALIYQRKTMEEFEVQENEVVIAKLPSNKSIGIKYNRNISTCDNEYERAIEEGQEAKRILALKDKLENGSVEVDQEKDQLVLNIEIDEEEIKQRNEMRILERKKTKLKYLKVEASLVDYDCKIKSCLGLDKADPKKAYEYMDLMMGLDISPLMLKKHPLIVDVMKRLRRYIGNVKEWKLAGDSLETFEADAEKIRQKAEEVFMKFISLFDVTDSSSFWDVFDSEVEKFEKETKDMTESELFALCAEPNCRQAFFDSYDDKKDAENLSKNKEAVEEKEKENSGVAANNVQVQEETP